MAKSVLIDKDLFSKIYTLLCLIDPDFGYEFANESDEELYYFVMKEVQSKIDRIIAHKKYTESLWK
jgi:hypothetical protein